MRWTIAFSVQDPETGAWVPALTEGTDRVWFDSKEKAIQEAHETPNLVWVVTFDGDNPLTAEGPFGDYAGLQELPPEVIEEILRNAINGKDETGPKRDLSHLN